MSASTPQTPDELFGERRGIVLPDEKPAVKTMLAAYGIDVTWRRLDLNNLSDGWRPSPDEDSARP